MGTGIIFLIRATLKALFINGEAIYTFDGCLSVTYESNESLNIIVVIVICLLALNIMVELNGK